MNEIYVSFYMRDSCVRIFVDTLRGIGSPKYICFMIQEDDNSFAIIPYKKMDFVSHHVSSKVYEGSSVMRVFSKKLCNVMINMNHWNPDSSYRVPGVVLDNHEAAIFDLKQAEIIK